MTVCCWLRRASRALMSLSYLNLPKSMSLHTGGRAIGATSTRSRSTSPASCRARSRGTMPTCSPSGPTSRTSRARICSLTRGSTLMGPPQVSSRVRDRAPSRRPRHMPGPARPVAANGGTTPRGTPLFPRDGPDPVAQGQRVGAGAPLETPCTVRNNMIRNTTRVGRRTDSSTESEIDMLGGSATRRPPLLRGRLGFRLARGEQRAQSPDGGDGGGLVRRLYRHDRDHVVVAQVEAGPRGTA